MRGNMGMYRHLKEELAWDRQLQAISNIMLFKTVIPLRNLSLNNITCIAIWFLVTYYNF